MAKFKHSFIVFPQGILRQTWLDKPSQPFDGKGEPTYKTDLLLDDTAEVRAFLETTTAKAVSEAREAKVKLKKVFNPGIRYPEDHDEDDFLIPEGKQYAKLHEDYRDRIAITFKSQYRPGMIDAAKQPLADGVKIFAGDVGRVKAQINPYEGFGSGISYRLAVVQLIQKNASFTAGAVNTDGFDDESENGGYVQDSDDEIPF